jgi:hypothetical protein
VFRIPEDDKIPIKATLSRRPKINEDKPKKEKLKDSFIRSFDKITPQ